MGPLAQNFVIFWRGLAWHPLKNYEEVVQAGPGTLIHPNLDKIITKWVAIKDLDVSPTRNLTRISVRIFLEGSRGPYLDFLFTISGPQNPQKSQNPILNLHTWPQPWRAWKIQKCQFLKNVFPEKLRVPGAQGGPWGPKGAHGALHWAPYGALGPPMGPKGALPISYYFPNIPPSVNRDRCGVAEAVYPGQLRG